MKGSVLMGSNNRPSAIKTELSVESWPFDRGKPYPRESAQGDGRCGRHGGGLDLDKALGEGAGDDLGLWRETAA